MLRRSTVPSPREVNSRGRTSPGPREAGGDRRASRRAVAPGMPVVRVKAEPSRGVSHRQAPSRGTVGPTRSGAVKTINDSSVPTRDRDHASADGTDRLQGMTPSSSSTRVRACGPLRTSHRPGDWQDSHKPLAGHRSDRLPNPGEHPVKNACVLPESPEVRGGRSQAVRSSPRRSVVRQPPLAQTARRVAGAGTSYFTAHGLSAGSLRQANPTPRTVRSHDRNGPSFRRSVAM